MLRYTMLDEALKSLRQADDMTIVFKEIPETVYETTDKTCGCVAVERWSWQLRAS